MMRWSLTICLLWVLGVVGVFALDNEVKLESESDSIEIKVDIPESITSNLDSLLCSWMTCMIDSVPYTDSIHSHFTDSAGPDFADSVYMKRLQLLSESSAIELPFNNKVKAYITLYGKRRREQTEAMLGLSRYFFPMFEEELDRAGLPMELKYLPVIESALNPLAFSRAGASGLWQFMYSTGKMYGLNVTSYIDERRDPEKATKAAVKYLGDMYKIYKDWYLVIAAYNCGPGNVNKAIRRAGNKRDYWKIYYYLPRETRGYVPAFIAANYIMNYNVEHNLSARKPTYSIVTDTFMVNETLHLGQVSELIGCSIDELKYLNPQYRRSVIPAGKKTYALRMPMNYSALFLNHEDSASQYKTDKYLEAKRDVVSPGSYSYSADAPNNSSLVYYKVKQGDNLGYIASWYNVKVSRLRYWNNIRRNLIRVGQKLKVYVPANKSEHYSRINSLSFASKQSLVGKSVPANKGNYASSPTSDGKYVYYKVRSGDNLWSIARKFPGISSNDIKRINNISTNLLNVGQVLKIKPKG